MRLTFGLRSTTVSSTAMFVLVLACAVFGVSGDVVGTAQNGSVVAVLATISECATMYKLMQATQSNSFMEALFVNLSESSATTSSAVATRYTLLAFTDDASNALASQNSADSALLTTPANEAALLSYHIIPGHIINFNQSFEPFYQTGLFRYGSGFDNLGFGNNQNVGVKLSSNNTGQFTTGLVTATVLKTIFTDYGVIHVIDTVVTIPSDIATVYKTLKLTDYGAWMTISNLTSTIKAIEGITVLIPQQGGITTFLNSANSGQDINSALKTAIIEYQIISGVYFSNQIGSSSGLPVGTAQTTYFNSQPIYAVDSTHFGTTSTGTSKITITTPDIIFDSGVIHIVDTVLLPPSIANAQTTPTLNALSQIYPAGEDPSSNVPLGSDVPIGAIVGGVLAGVVVIVLGIVLFYIIKRRRLIASLENEKRMRDLEMNEHHTNDTGGNNRADSSTQILQHLSATSEQQPQFESATSSMLHGILPPVYEATIKVEVAEEAEADATLTATSRTTTLSPTAEENEDDDSEEESDEEELKASYNQIMQFRKNQWAVDDVQKKKKAEKRLSSAGSGDAAAVASNKNLSVDATGASKQNKRLSSAHNESPASSGGLTANEKRNSRRISHAEKHSSRRMSTASNGWGSSEVGAPSIIITDAKEAKKEAVRNSWWSATGVGSGTQDATVLEAQALREEERRSWWSGSGEVQEQLKELENSRRGSIVSTGLFDKRKSVASIDKHKSTASSGGDRRRSNGTLSLYAAAALDNVGEQQQQQQQQGSEIEYVHPTRGKEQHRRSTAISTYSAFKPSHLSALADSNAVIKENSGAANVPAPKRRQKRKSNDTTALYSVALSGSSPVPIQSSGTHANGKEEESALAFVVGEP
ncbi:Stabilin-2 [Physocladia obscura]|uniref:Stabilin-2 n=1 Tax=Physocladia obscura TaxID=109957 RepID=A0AAD5XDT1_9FUNG|nr:Stabilin-2 [Physocladia obscura]